MSVQPVDTFPWGPAKVKLPLSTATKHTSLKIPARQYDRHYWLRHSHSNSCLICSNLNKEKQ